jgi:glycosyltransferase 2 family protein
VGTRKWLIVAGCGLSFSILAVILWRLEWSVFISELRHLDFIWLAAAMIFIILGTAIRSLRWNLLAGSPLTAIPSFWSAVVMGFMLSQIYPLRAGEIARIFLLSEIARLPLGKAATSALIDRVADVLLLGVCAIAVVTVQSSARYAEHFAAATLVAGALAVTGLIVFAKGDRFWRNWGMRFSGRVPARLRERIMRFYSGALATTALSASPARLAQTMALTGIIFLFDFAVMHSVVEAFDWQLPLMASVTVLVFLGVGTALPSAPGNAGIYQLACVLALALFGIDESQAFAYSIVLQVCVLAVNIPAAGIAAAAHRNILSKRAASSATLNDLAR